MSYDVSLYFDDEIFSMEQWQSVIAEFEPRQHELRVINERDRRMAEWTISRNNATSWLILQEIKSATLVKPVEANWEILVSRVSHSPRSVWLQFALSYHALILMNNVTFYDRRVDLVIRNEADYLNFAAEIFALKGLSTMFELGLADGDGVPIF